MAMSKEKVTLTLDTARLKELRNLVGSRSISAAVDDAVSAHVLRLRHLTAVDDWLAELERVRTEITQFQKSITDIEEEARRAGIPPGWLR